MPLQNSTSRSFTFTASSTFLPTAPPVQQIHYQVETWINPWLTATPAGSNTQSGAVGPLQDGVHIIYAYATEGGNATSINTGSANGTSSSPLIGQIQARVFFINNTGPTAAPATVNGSVTRSGGAPLAGVVMRLSGAQSVTTITDSQGRYHFDNVETDNFYTVTPGLVNNHFSPENRSFSLLANMPDAVFTATQDAVITGNAIDTAEYFVRQHYLDFLNREPDESGFNFWSDQLLGCGNDATCIERRRINVSAAYFLSIEFQQTGYLAYRMYKSAYGNLPGAPVPVRFDEFLADTRQLGQGVIVNRHDWERTLENNKLAFANEFVSRSRFAGLYAGLSDAEFVAALNRNADGVLSPAEQDTLVGELSSGAKTRAQVLRAVAENNELTRAQFSKAFVLMQYFGYLRRDPNQGPDVDYSGYNFWLNKLNQLNGNFEQAETVKAFITSTEYRQRFGP